MGVGTMIEQPSLEMVERAHLTARVIRDEGLDGSTLDMAVVESIIALALTAAHAQGRAKGLEETVKIVAGTEDVYVVSNMMIGDLGTPVRGASLRSKIIERLRAAEEARRG